jgi:pyroglutamyl-peptidase
VDLLVIGEAVTVTILITGFDPFAGRAVNTSWEVARAVAQEGIDGVRIRTRQLPVEFVTCGNELVEAVAGAQADIVLCLGEGSDTVALETVAVNRYTDTGVDNAGRHAPAQTIDPGGSGVLRTLLPVADILIALDAGGHRYALSGDAGDFCCNETFYRLMQHDCDAVRGFVHVPALDADADVTALRDTVIAILSTHDGLH